MTAVRTLAVAAALGVALTSAATGPANAGSCGRFGGWGIGVTQDIATFMSTKAMHQALDKENAHPVAGVKTECNNNALVYIQCHTFTRACSK